MPLKLEPQNFSNGHDRHIRNSVADNCLSKKAGVIGVGRLSELPVDFHVVRLANEGRLPVGGFNLLGNVVIALEGKHPEWLNPLSHVRNGYILHAIAVGVNVIDDIAFRVLFDDDAIIGYLDGRADFHGVKECLNVLFPHAYATVGDVAADAVGAVGAVNAVVALNLHPTIAQRIIWTRRNLVFGVRRVNPRRINLLSANLIIARRRGRAHLAQA